MSTSTDAILFYGFCWTDEGRLPWQKDDEDGDAEEDPDDGEWESRFARLGGLTGTWQDHGYYEHRKAIVETATCEVIRHCHADCAMYGVGANGSITRASRGNPEAAPVHETSPEWDGQLRAYCALMGIETRDQQPRWWLVSDWS